MGETQSGIEPQPQSNGRQTNQLYHVDSCFVLFCFCFCLVSGRVKDMKLMIREKEKRNLKLHLSKSPHQILDACMSNHPPL